MSCWGILGTSPAVLLGDTGERSRKALRCSSSMGDSRRDEGHEVREQGRGWCSSERRAPLRAGRSAFAGPRSPAPLARGGASGSGCAVLQSCYGTSVGTRHRTPRLCWCQHSFVPPPSYSSTPAVPEHRADLLTVTTPADSSPASSPCSTPHTTAWSQVSSAQETFESAQWASLALRVSSRQNAGEDADTPAW